MIPFLPPCSDGALGPILAVDWLCRIVVVGQSIPGKIVFTFWAETGKLLQDLT